MIADADLEAAQERYEKAKRAKMEAKAELEAVQGEFHTKLMARRDSGETMTQSDMKALVKASIHTDARIQKLWLAFLAADGEWRLSKVAWDKAYRAYEDRRGYR